MCGNFFCDQIKIFKVTLCELFRSSDVRLQLITECPRTWPNWETCIKVNLTIPLHVLGSDYQLDRTSLEEMWNKYAKKGLEKMNLKVRSKTAMTDMKEKHKSFLKCLKINNVIIPT